MPSQIYCCYSLCLYLFCSRFSIVGAKANILCIYIIFINKDLLRYLIIKISGKIRLVILGSPVDIYISVLMSIDIRPHLLVNTFVSRTCTVPSPMTLVKTLVSLRNVKISLTAFLLKCFEIRKWSQASMFSRTPFGLLLFSYVYPLFVLAYFLIFLSEYFYCLQFYIFWIFRSEYLYNLYLYSVLLDNDSRTIVTSYLTLDFLLLYVILWVNNAFQTKKHIYWFCSYQVQRSFYSIRLATFTNWEIHSWERLKICAPF